MAKLWYNRTRTNFIWVKKGIRQSSIIIKSFEKQNSLNLESFECPESFDEEQAAKLIRKTHRILVLFTFMMSVVVSFALAFMFRNFLSFPARIMLFLSPASGLGLIFYRVSFHRWDNKVSQLIVKGKTWGKVFSSHYAGKSLLFGSLPGNFLPIIGPACGITFAYLAFQERAKSVGGRWVGEELAVAGFLLSVIQLIGTLNAGLYYMHLTPWF